MISCFTLSCISQGSHLPLKTHMQSVLLCLLVMSEMDLQHEAEVQQECSAIIPCRGNAAFTEEPVMNRADKYPKNTKLQAVVEE